MHGASTVTDRASFRDVATHVPDGTRVPVVAHLRADPFSAYRRARGDEPSFLFETSGGRPGWGYFGVSPDRFHQVSREGALSTLRELLDGESLVRGDCPVPYPGGHFGWLSYDVARDIETLPSSTTDDRGLPRLQLGRYPCVAAWQVPGVADSDRETGPPSEARLQLVASPRVDGDADAAYERGLERIGALERAIRRGTAELGSPPVEADAVAFERTCDRERYAARVRRVKRYIRAGDTFQANISHRLEAPAAVHPVEAFAAVRKVNPAPYAGLVEFPGVDLVSASPELLFERVGRRVHTEPIAGTRPRGATATADERLAAALRSDEKERAEHAMLVDLERNDLGKVSEYGSVTVDEYRRVDRYASVMHLVSVVSGTLRSGTHVVDVVRAMFPGGTITGAPKPRTMEIIDELEETRRGPYTGGMAAFGFDGRATTNILIRTLVRHGTRYSFRVGGGVVHDSDPDAEYDETLAKARGLVDAVDVALGDRLDLGVGE
jgi:anthranilate synthase component 1